MRQQTSPRAPIRSWHFLHRSQSALFALAACLLLSSSLFAAQTKSTSPAPSSPAPAPTPKPTPAPQPAAKQHPKDQLDRFADDLSAAALRTITSLGQRPIKDLVSESQSIWSLSVQYLQPKSHTDAFAQTDAALRLTRALSAAGEDLKPTTLRTLAANPVLARTLALAMTREDNPARVFAVLDQLAKVYPKEIADARGLQSLVAATCVVFDSPPLKRPQTAAELLLWNSGAFEAPPADPVEVFGYFTQNRASMLFPIDRMPVQALIHVVNTPCSADELRWALKNYANNAAVGKLYDRIRYDTQHFKFNKPKKIVATDGYTLQNIWKVGGVCEEQAFFATNVGKAIGVPTAYVDAVGPDVAHAYVGYLRSAGSNTAWDFDEGRYDEYEDIRGNITDPQTGRRLHDGQVALSAGMMLDKPADRDAAIALADAAATLISATGFPEPKPIADLKLPTGPNAAPRTPGVDSAEAFLLESVERCPHFSNSWQSVAALAKAGRLDDKRVKFWSEAVMRLCMRAPNPNPDFAFDILGAMFEGVKDPKAQSALWDWTAQKFSSRVDLAGSARLAQARLWNSNGDPGRAWAIYEQLIRSSRNEGTVIVDALADAERLLASEKKPPATATELYEVAFKRIGKPGKVSAAFVTGSNYYRVGSRLAELYEESGKPNDAQRIRRQIEFQEEP